MPKAQRRPTAQQAEDYVRCRSLGHSWDAIPVTNPPAAGVALDLRCEHCGMLRRDILSRYTGQVLSRRYTQPDGYKDAELHSRSDWRAMYVTTLSDALKAYGADEGADKLRVVKHKGAAA